jgi:hypothetical protein
MSAEQATTHILAGLRELAAQSAAWPRVSGPVFAQSYELLD